jgi:Coenzyme PQQ synthesis protein D (PqqD)
VSPSLKLQPHVAWQMVGGLAVVMDLASGRTVGLNPSASFIWERLAAGSGERLVDDFAARFHLDSEAAKHDVEQFVGYLVEQNLVAAEP